MKKVLLLAFIGVLFASLFCPGLAAHTISIDAFNDINKYGGVQYNTLTGNTEDKDQTWVPCSGSVYAYITGTTTITLPKSAQSCTPTLSVALWKKNGSTHTTVKTITVDTPTLIASSVAKVTWPSSTQAYVAYNGRTLSGGSYKFYFKSRGLLSGSSTLFTGSLCKSAPY